MKLSPPPPGPLQFAVPAALILGLACLTACGGGGGGAGPGPGTGTETETGPETGPETETETETGPETETETETGPETETETETGPETETGTGTGTETGMGNRSAENFRAGPDAISGIDRIPDSMVKMTKAQSQAAWVIAERAIGHANAIGRFACRSYVIDTKAAECGRNNRAGIQRDSNGTIISRANGSAPFTEVVDAQFDYTWIRGQIQAMPAVKIVNMSEHYFFADLTIGENDNWLTVHSTSNGASNVPLFEYSWFTGRPDTTRELIKTRIGSAIAANKLIFVSGWSKDSNGNYIRHPGSSSCRDVDSGCLWAPYVLSNGRLGGTSGGAVLVSSAIASVLAVFPDTSPVNLAKFAKACAKKSGNNIEQLLTKSGGIGVADFNCMGGVVIALRNLPVGGRTRLTVGGRSMTFGNRDLTVTFAQSRSARYSGGGEKRKGLHFRIVPNGKNAAMAFAALREGGFFASFGAGTYDSFFGFRRGHGNIFGMEYTLGHEALFLHLTDVRSEGGKLVSYAEGKSFGLATRKKFHPAERVTLKLSANFEKFLGGTAKIPFGKVRMDRGRWHRRAALSAEYAAYGGAVLGFDVQASFPEREKTAIEVGFRFLWAF